MLRELLSIFRGPNESLTAMGDSFTEMLGIALENALAAGEMYFGRKVTPEERTRIYEKDVQINKLERKIRKRVAVHLAMADGHSDVPYCLLLMSLVKDVERIGDYAKNVLELVDLHSKPLPEDEIAEELREIRREVEESLKAATEIFVSKDRERALHYIQAGRDLAHRCDVLIAKIAQCAHEASLTTALVLGARYYKRMGGHILNILSSVVMPLHKIDYYDEDVVEGQKPQS